MRTINHQETNGIIIGPELSRIFAEIIFQEIDRKIELKMIKEGLNHGKDYHCSRYIDDYYLYFNDQKIAERFTDILSDELEIFKLYLNNDKFEVNTRPFISDISIKKLSISNYITKLSSDLSSETKFKINNQKEINKIRRILHSKPGKNHAITNYFLSSILNRIYVITNLNEDRAVEVINLFIDIVFYLIRTDTRVTSIYRLTEIIIAIRGYTKTYQKYNQSSIYDKLYYQMSESIKTTLKEDASVELMNLLISATELGKTYRIEAKIINEIINSCRAQIRPDEKKLEILNYFEITTLLYYMKSDSEYEDQIFQVISDSKILFQHYPVLDYSESAHLLLDLIACPYLDKDIKVELAEITFQTCDDPLKKEDEDINRFVNYVLKHSWFSNWGPSIDLTEILKKKRYMISY